MEDGEKLLVAKGGEGGAPHNGWNGLKGQARNLLLDLKVIADIGLVGYKRFDFYSNSKNNLFLVQY